MTCEYKLPRIFRSCVPFSSPLQECVGSRRVPIQGHHPDHHYVLLRRAIRTEPYSARSLRRSLSRLVAGGRYGCCRGPELHGLNESAASRRIPHRKAHPLPSCRVEWNLETMPAERRQIRRGENLPVGVLSISPYNFHKLERKRPFNVRPDRTLTSEAF